MRRMIKWQRARGGRPGALGPVPAEKPSVRIERRRLKAQKLAHIYRQIASVEAYLRAPTHVRWVMDAIAGLPLYVDPVK